MGLVTVANEKIVRLQYEAQGFRNAFYILYNSMNGVDGCEKWNQDGDVMAVLATNACLSIELYFKFLQVIVSFDPTVSSGTHIFGHSLKNLYDELNNRDSTYIQDLEDKFKLSKYRSANQTLEDFIKAIKESFIKWRYSYSEGDLNINLNALSDVLNILEQYSLNKFNEIAGHLQITNAVPHDKQTLSIYNFDDIKKLY